MACAECQPHHVAVILSGDAVVADKAAVQCRSSELIITDSGARLLWQEHDSSVSGCLLHVAGANIFQVSCGQSLSGLMQSARVFTSVLRCVLTHMSALLRL